MAAIDRLATSELSYYLKCDLLLCQTPPCSRKCDVFMQGPQIRNTMRIVVTVFTLWMTHHKHPISLFVSKIVCDGQCVLYTKCVLHFSARSSLKIFIYLFIYFCSSKCLGNYAHSIAQRNTGWSSSKTCVIVPDCNPDWNVLTNFSSIIPTIKDKMVLQYSTL
jgi:hypothetical protein